MHKHIIYIMLASWGILASLPANAQTNFKGLWHGYFTAVDGGVPLPNTGMALNVAEQVGDMISGKVYPFGTAHLDFDGIVDFIGTIDGNTIKITELKILKYRKQPSNPFDLCIKYMSLVYSQKDTTHFLAGNWNGFVTGKMCDPGKVYLKKFDPKQPDGFMPVPESVFAALARDQGQKPRFLNTELGAPVVVNVSNTVLKLSVRDYLREDNDTVSVYFNRRNVLNKQLIRKKPVNFTIRLYKLSELNELVLYAENLGQVPPNTSVLTIDDGVRKQNLIITSTEQVSAVVHLRYTGLDKSPPITK